MGGVVGIQTSVPAVTPTVAYELSPAPLGFSPGVPGEHYLGQSPTEDRALVEVQIPVEGKKKKKSLDARERIKERVQVYPISPLPQDSTVHRFSPATISPSTQFPELCRILPESSCLSTHPES